MKITVLAVLLWLPVVNCDWQLQKKAVCFGTKGSSFGSFKVTKSGTISSIKLVHESGEVNCKAESDGRSFWGCNGQELATVITNTNDKVIFPKSAVDNIWFTVPNYTSKSKELIYNTPASRTKVEAGETLRLWYTEDLRHSSEGDNSGKSCAAVYAVITQDLTLEDTIKINEDQNKQIQALTKLIDAERKITEKLKTDFKALTKLIDAERKITEKLKTDFKDLVNKQGKQEEAGKKRTAKVETEMQDLVNKQRNEGEAVKKITAKVETEMQDLVNKQRKQEEAVKKITAKVETEMQDLVNKQRKQEEDVKKRTGKVETEMQKFRKENSLAQCDPENVIYFPRDTTKYKMQQCYTFNNGNAPYYLQFVGYGYHGKKDSIRSYRPISFNICVIRCEALRKNDVMWNGMSYYWSIYRCTCSRNLRSIDTDYKAFHVLYSFTSL